MIFFMSLNHGLLKPVLVVEVSFSTQNVIYSKQFILKFHNFTESKFDLRINPLNASDAII